MNLFCELLFVALFFCVTTKNVDGDTWVVLVAGSKDYSNYRHQADICQAYHQISDAGVPDERIIVWMYDDIAHNLENPHKGSIINYKKGPNVYPGTPLDYTKKDHKIANFLKLLRGEDMTGIGSGKSLKSGANDRVFIYFSDHGGPGVICFPGMVELHVKDLLDTLKYAYDHTLYKEMIFYMEACESGSMFDGFAVEEMNIYAVTASNPSQSSYACDHDWSYLTYLNDCWSRDFLNDTRWALNNKMMSTRTFDEQFQWVKVQSTQSPECRYGLMDYSNYTLDYFQGEPSMNHDRVAVTLGEKSEGRVSSYDSRLLYLEKRVQHAVRRQLADDVEYFTKKLEEHRELRKEKDLFWGSFAEFFKLDVSRYQADTCHRQVKFPADCMKDAVETYKSFCGGFDDYSAKYYKLLYLSCVDNVGMERMTEYWQQKC